ncbi:hypothetical protein BDFB_015280, partial [Asbolus verrucosus]
MKLPTLAERRKRGDLVITFQAIALPNSPMKHLFPLSTTERTRGHKFKLSKEMFKTSIRR